MSFYFCHRKRGGGEMAEKKETAARDKNGVRKQNYKRFQEGKDYEPTEAETTSALCDMFRRGFLGAEETEEGGEVQRKPGRPPKYETVEAFVDVVTRYIDYIEDKAKEGVRLIPDIEGFCSFAGISRETLNEWEKTRPGAYSDTIKSFKTSVAAYKKQLAMSGKIPPIVFATDFNNNHGYTQQNKQEIQITRKLEGLPDRSDIVRRLPPKAAGSVIDSDIDINLNDEP
jgi:hypothetical protein